MTRSRPTAFTLVELLVVIAILGVLVALLIPAVQAAREAARRLQCKNQLRQLALAAITHEEQHGHFPTGGWHKTWAGDSDRGFGHRQPGGWAFNILPFIEETSLYELAGDGLPERITEQQLKGAARLLETPISILYCPSRRAPIAYPHWHDRYGQLVNANSPPLVGKLDYAINGGETMSFLNPTPSGLENFSTWYLSFGTTDVLGNPVFSEGIDPGFPRNPLVGDLGFNGVSFRISEVGVRHVTDGVSNTYLIGEKFIPPKQYETGPDYFDEDPRSSGRFVSDQFAWCTGYGHSNTRMGGVPPRRDANDPNGFLEFGSAHTAGFHVAFCDGSVRVIEYGIDLAAHMAGANRRDGTIRGLR